MNAPALDLEADDLRAGVTGLVLAVAQVLHDVLEHQALRRLDAGSLTEPEGERVGRALLRLRATLDELAADPPVAEAAARVLRGLEHALRPTLREGAVHPAP